jgi:hypothetical protein
VFCVNPRILVAGLIRLLIIRGHVWSPFAFLMSLERRDGDCSCLFPRELKIGGQTRKLQESSEGAVSDAQRERNSIWPILRLKPLAEEPAAT